MLRQLSKNARLFSTLNKAPTQILRTPQRAAGQVVQQDDAPAHGFESPDAVRHEFTEMWQDLEKLMNASMPLVKEHYERAGRPRVSGSLTEFALPPAILERLGPLKDEGHSIDECMETVKTVMDMSVSTMHPYFFDKLYAGSDPMGQMAEFITTVLNTAVHVYHVAPVFTVMEVELMKIFAAKFGFDPETADGCLNPGGTMSNIMAVLVARNEFFPHVRMEGWKGEDQPVAFTARQSHYSITRGAMAAGVGMNNMIQVASDRMTGQMIPEALDEAIRQQIALGKKPFFVNSVGGSTVMGSFDDQHAISAVCKEHGLWHHIDGCWGGIMAFSEKHKHLYAGSELADSVAINAHKAFGVPNQCSYLLINNRPHALAAANTSGATYLFHESEYSKYDRADKTLACGRRADGLKLWMTLKRHGIAGMGKLADFSMEKAAYITQQIKAQPEKFEMINEPMATNICFSYTPPAFRGQDYSWEQKTNVHKMIFDRMLVDGVMLIQHNPLEEFNLPNFFRLTLKNEKTRLEDMDFILEKIDTLGQDIDQSMV